MARPGSKTADRDPTANESCSVSRALLRLESLFEATTGPAPLSARDRKQLNAAIAAAVPPNRYPASLGGALVEIVDAFEKLGFSVVEPTIHGARPDGRERFALLRSKPDTGEVPQKSMLVYSWHKMDSGNYEITCYVS